MLLHFFCALLIFRAHAGEEKQTQRRTRTWDCEVSGWSKWSPCSSVCASGTQKRTRTITREADGGKACPALKQTQSCNDAVPCFSFKLNLVTGNEIVVLKSGKTWTILDNLKKGNNEITVKKERPYGVHRLYERDVLQHKSGRGHPERPRIQ